MNLIQESYQRLFPEREFNYNTQMEYNRRLSNFNANIKFQHSKISVHLNLEWKDIDEEIKIGLIQHLLLKVFKKKDKTSQNIDLYNNFVKNIDILTTATKINPQLAESFNRVNEQFFAEKLEIPNLCWGSNSFRKLASYNYHEDTIVVSTLFKEVRIEILDYLMYHELLHKYFKFKHKNGRSSYHNKEFKEAEAKFPQQKEIEREISTIVRNRHRKKSFFSFLNP